MDIVLLTVAFILGFCARLVGLPPLVGYLAAGFGLHALGVGESEVVTALADVGIILLLFGIGLKLRPRTLAAPAVWGTTLVFAVVATAVVAGLLALLGILGIAGIGEVTLTTALVVGFACSFCSTVFAVKTLERTNEEASLSGRITLGVLILQDILAVLFLVAVVGRPPSVWALVAVPVLLACRPVFGWLLQRAGHDETFVLFGFAVALAAGAGVFALVDLKPDLGALVVGAMLARHPRASELAHRLLDFKDLFLVGFFLSIGLQGTPSASAWMVGSLLVLLLPLRMAVLFWLMTRFRLRVRTALNGSFTLTTFSEFGLIVTSAAAAADLVDPSWVAVVAVAVALSFVVGALGASTRFNLYGRLRHRLGRFERHPLVEGEAVIDVNDAQVLIFGMGRVGTGAYDELILRRGDVVLGIDHSVEKVVSRISEGRQVILGNALDRDFWERVGLHPDITLVVATMGRHQANLECVRRVREYLPGVHIAAIATYPDQVEELHVAGVDVARNLYEEAGQALADDALLQTDRDTGGAGGLMS